MKIDNDNNLLCECGSQWMHNVTEYILPGDRNREKTIIIITWCEQCHEYNSYSFRFHKGSIITKHNSGFQLDGYINILT